MKDELKKKIYAVVAAASRFERLIDHISIADGNKVNDKAKCMNALIDAVQSLSDDARGLLEELVE